MSIWLNTTHRILTPEQVSVPCLELDYCPYGQLVEAFPLHETARQYAIDHDRYVRWVSRETGEPIEFGNPGTWAPCTKDDPGATPDLNWACSQVDDPYSCHLFGHDCPVFYHAEFVER